MRKTAFRLPVGCALLHSCCALACKLLFLRKLYLHTFPAVFYVFVCLFPEYGIMKAYVRFQNTAL